MSRGRIVLRVVLGGLVAAMALFVCAVLVAPLVARAIALSQAATGSGRARPLPAGYRPLHKGHIDMGTGLYVREDEDLALPGSPSFVLRRTYRTRDSRSRAFGIGGSHTGDWFLVGDSRTFQWADVILEDGGRIHYERTSSGTGISNARYKHRATPSSFYGSELAWTGADWMVRQRDGTVLTFRACSPASGNCAITSIREPDGQIIRFARDAEGTLMRIDAGAQWIAFDYGGGRRIARARDNAGHAVAYTYDARGRLRQALESDGTKRSYDYDDHDRLTRIEEPGRIVENRYDAADMCVWQRVRFPAGPPHGVPADDEPDIFQFSYVMENGRVRQVDTHESNAPSHRCVFTVHGHLESETYDFDTDRAKTITYQRDPGTGLVSGLTLMCGSGRWRASRSLPATPRTQPRVKAELLAMPCDLAGDKRIR